MSNNSSEWKRRRTGSARRQGRTAEVSRLLERLEERRLLAGQAPEVTIQSEGYFIQPEEELRLAASAMDSDSAPEELTYAWDLDGDNEFDDAFTANPIVEWSALEQLGYVPGTTRTVALRVTDAQNNSGTDTALITVMEKDPEIRGAATVNEGSVYTVSLHYFWSDPLVRWQIEWGDGTFSEVGPGEAFATHVYEDDRAAVYDVSALVFVEQGGRPVDWPGGSLAVRVNNVAPTATVTALPAGSVYEGEVPALSVATSDPGPLDTVSVDWVVWKDGMEHDSGSGAELPGLSAEGVYEISVTAADDDGGSSTSSFMLNVLNMPPIANDDPVRGVAGEVIGGNVLINDTDQGGDSLTVRLVSEPIPGLVLNSDGTFTYVSQEGPGATITFTYVASDGVDESNVATVTITVASSNRAPVGGADSYSPDEDQVFGGNVLDNDADADGDTLVVTLVSGPAHGRLTLNATGAFTYTPDADFFGVDGFDYYAADPSGATTGHVHVTLTVLSVPDAPVVIAQPVVTAEDTPVTVSVAVSDVEGDVTQILVISGPQHGTLEAGDAPGTWVYRPHADFNGTDQFVVKALDETELRGTATVHVQVTPVNDAPRFGAPVTVVIDEDQSVQGWLPVVDVDGDVIQVVRVEQGVGSVQMNADGAFVYTPAPNYNGEDSFRVWVTDGSGAEVTGEVRFLVKAVNDAPAASPTGITLVENTSAGGTVSGHDVDGDPLAFSVLSGPAHGTVVLNADGTFVYTPAADYHGTDQFTFRAFDGTAYSAAATVSVTVTPDNQAPVANPDLLSATQDTQREIKFSELTKNDVDRDGDVLNVRVVGLPSFGTFKHVDGGFVYVPNLGFNGVDSFKYVVTDGEAESEPVVVKINVARAASGTVTMRPDGVVVVNGSLGSDAITLSAGSTAGWLKVSFSGALGVFTKDVVAPSKRVVVFGYSGNDEIRVGHSVSVPAWLYGDEGADALELGSQGGVAWGGSGDDQLGGGGGRDILIGGEGADDLIGAGDGDILIAPYTKYDDRLAFSQHEEAWSAIRREWDSSRTASQRISNLRNGTGTADRENGGYFLSRETVFDDQASWPQDSLSGRGGSDWYFFKADEDKATGSGTWELL